MSLHIYNTYSKKKEEFKPIEPGKVQIYSCGPTVYSHPHIGNFRSFIAADILCRYLRYKGYEVTQVMNITDVGHLTTDDNLSADVEGVDKIQLAAQSEMKTPKEITGFYTSKFFELVKTLNLQPANHYPKATDHIPEMIEMVKKLLEKGYAYEINGNVYYEISRFEKYGRLSGNTLENLKAGARVEVKSDKRNPMDFALWKQDPKHLMQWDSPWGRGFPGWHIECSAMSLKYLGNEIDIHTGGEDNIFPHHECEIAQSDAFIGKQVVQRWFHTGHLLVDNQKMSKSLGNFYTVDDILKQGYHPLVLRYALMSSHYRQQINFNMDLLKSAHGAIERLRNFKRMIEDKSSESNGATSKIDKKLPRSNSRHSSGQAGRSLSRFGGAEAPQGLLIKVRKSFEESLDDDLNISAALGSIFDFVTEVNKLSISSADATGIKQTLNDFDKVLGILEIEKAENLDDEITRLINERENARNRKDFRRADEIRDILYKKGIVLEDSANGTRWKRVL
ncbi:MAG: cysteine--tRNA ligase [Planctomycetota bacterium]